MSSRKPAIIIAICWSVFLLAGASVPGDALRNVEVFTYDKLLHIAGFAVFAYLWLRCFPGQLLKIGILGAAFGLFIEAYQHVMPIGRFFDLYDALADLAGLALGTGIFLIATNRKRRIQTDPPTNEQL
ncbi:MAG: VanZ family protein [Rubricoccaceae bacterium]|nr:VanZ family protein [Rubricoccaceae bacterium]